MYVRPLKAMPTSTDGINCHTCTYSLMALIWIGKVKADVQLLHNISVSTKILLK